MARVAFDIDYFAAAGGNHLAATDAAARTDRSRCGCAAGFERRNRRAAPRLSQGADRHRARCESLEELAARRPWRLSVCPIRIVFRFHLVFIVHLAFDLHMRLIDASLSWTPCDEATSLQRFALHNLLCATYQEL